MEHIATEPAAAIARLAPQDWWWSAGMLVGLLAASFFALSVGPLQLPLSDIWASFTGSADQLTRTTVLEIRAPRTLLALAVGAALGISGAVVQTLFRNPLAEPGLLGISSGAALAAVACIVLLPATLSSIATLPAAAFVGAALASMLVVKIAQLSMLEPRVAQLLAGIAINALAASGIGVLSYLADDLALRSLTFWMFGSLGAASWSTVLFCLPLILATPVLAPLQAHRLDVLQLDESDAVYLGVDTRRLRRLLLVLVVASVGAAVALAGIIGFVGLVVPHLLRLAGVRDHRRLLPCSAVLGASLLLIADTVARTALAPGELPVGMITALLGSPFFLLLMMRDRNGLATPRC